MISILRSVARGAVYRLGLRGVPAGGPGLVYLHFPKCAGTSVHKALACAFPRDRITQLDAARSTQAAELLGHDVLAYRRDLLAYQLVSGGVSRLLSGHWGLDEHLCRTFADRWQFIALFRDPVERWFSHYFYDRYKAKSEYRRIDDSLEEFLATPRAVREGTVFVRMLTAGEPSADPDPDAACRTLEHFTLLGDQQNIGAFVEAVGRRLGKTLPVGQANVSPAKRDEVQKLIEQYRPAVERLCEPDSAVYAYAKKKMNVRS